LIPSSYHSFSVWISACFILLGFILEVHPFFKSARAQPAVWGARWCLWVGTAGLLGAVVLGFIQPPKSVIIQNFSGPEVEHRFLGIWSAGVFLALSVWRFLAGRRPSPLLVLVWLAALWVLGTQIVSGFRLGKDFLF
jgi:hypothetical protein